MAPLPLSDILHLGQQLDEFLFALGLVLAGFSFRHLRDVHRAEFRPAHRTELRLFVKIIRQILIVHRARGVRISENSNCLFQSNKNRA